MKSIPKGSGFQSPPFREDLGGSYAKKLFQNRLEKSDKTQALFLHQYLWIGIRDDGLYDGFNSHKGGLRLRHLSS